MVNSFQDFLAEERTIGKFSFTYEAIGVFFLILVLTAITSKLVSFIAGEPTDKNIAAKKSGVRNSLLLLRLSIMIIGVLLAFASSGIPMDRITIIIGSLSLGIGFGLQTIVNNLISGVILAVERPVEIGDQVEVAGKTGRISEIGIRSSKLISYDGAEIIIPNGDMLNQHVINWTLTNNQRRVELVVGVRYGTDLNKAKQILEIILKANKRILSTPEPLALLHQFNNSSIDLRVLFWCDVNYWIDIKSEIILAIDKAFKDAGIEIPFPQQDIYIRELPDLKTMKDDKPAFE
jgi:small-conductance mechanosensitive channel